MGSGRSPVLVSSLITHHSTHAAHATHLPPSPPSQASNIFLSDGAAKLGDFGIARVLEHTQDRGQSVVGTPYYMSPEICRNEPYASAADMFSVGAIVYELCALRHAVSVAERGEGW